MADNLRLLMNQDVGDAIGDSELNFFITNNNRREPELESHAEEGGSIGYCEQRGNPLADDNSSSDSRSSRDSARPTSPPLRRNPGFTYTNRSPEKQHRQRPSVEDVLSEKHDVLFQINRMQSRGGVPSKKMSIADSLSELKAERDRMVREMDMSKSVKFNRYLMMSFASGLECLNSTYDPFGVKLDGWSEHIERELPNYDEIFEELHEKYHTKSVMPPEIKLVLMVASSAFMFHMSKVMYKNAPGFEEIVRDDPEISKRIAAAAAKKIHEKEKGSTPMGGLAGLMSKMMGAGDPPAPQERPMSPPHESDVEQLFSDSESSNGGAAIIDA